jgi:hypothetical protein
LAIFNGNGVCELENSKINSGAHWPECRHWRVPSPSAVRHRLLSRCNESAYASEIRKTPTWKLPPARRRRCGRRGGNREVPVGGGRREARRNDDKISLPRVSGEGDKRLSGVRMALEDGNGKDFARWYRFGGLAKSTGGTHKHIGDRHPWAPARCLTV